MLFAGAGTVLGGASVDDGPAYGPVSTPASSGSTTLDNGLKAALYEGGTIAFLGASLVNQHSDVPAVVGRLKNILDTPLEQVRVKVQFLDGSDEVLVQGWVTEENLADEKAWQFMAPYPNDDPDRIAGANIPAINVY